MKKLLIVDDDEALRGLYRRRLSNAYEVVETGDPRQAVALALEHKPDAILLDLKMPNFDGFELCQNFRTFSYTSNLPIFVVTGQSGNYKKECEMLGATGYFEKPIDFSKLKRALAASLGATTPERARTTSLKMCVAVKLHGIDAQGQEFTDLGETETVSAAGFQCTSTRDLAEAAIVDVFLTGRAERYAGRARVAEHISAGLQRHRYRFDFESRSAEWVLQQP